MENLANKFAEKAEDIINRVEDEIDNLDDKPVTVYPIGEHFFAFKFLFLYFSIIINPF